MTVYELNLDGLVGPTHNYAGLSAGNIASTNNALRFSNPRKAAHQGIEKMRLLRRLGLKQAVLPPHQRPNMVLLAQLGFQGDPTKVIEQVKNTSLTLLSACYSASSMWAANAATISSSLDTKDHRVHFTAANLISNLHRHHEAEFSSSLLQEIFKDENYFSHHPVLPKALAMSDEGAANHTRLCEHHHQPGINFFVYGKKAFPTQNILEQLPTRFPARQTLEASEAIARSHQLDTQKVVFACQNPKAIDLGVFHNDVISVGNESLFFTHEEAFLNQEQVYLDLKNKAHFDLKIIQVDKQRISISDAVNSYLFNSQLLTLPDTQKMILVAPSECEENQKIRDYIYELVVDSQNPITEVYYLDLKQSMQNGGGPACLRLRVPLTEIELQKMHQGVIINDTLLSTLDIWIDTYYRDQLSINDLTDPSLITETYAALDALTQILQLGSIYPFQKE